MASESKKTLTQMKKVKAEIVEAERSLAKAKLGLRKLESIGKTIIERGKQATF